MQPSLEARMRIKAFNFSTTRSETLEVGKTCVQTGTLAMSEKIVKFEQITLTEEAGGHRADLHSTRFAIGYANIILAGMRMATLAVEQLRVCAVGNCPSRQISQEIPKDWPCCIWLGYELGGPTRIEL